MLESEMIPSLYIYILEWPHEPKQRQGPWAPSVARRYCPAAAAALDSRSDDDTPSFGASQVVSCVPAL